ncbi:MAG: S1 RNA-binding domain-containing protein [Lachnospiraceae bacterium]|nr:S1 RNA-binding domain-containing protein [Lachnospiraceae bacterium]
MKTAPETMDDLKDELEASFRTINEGDVLTGTVIGISDTEILVDFDYYAPGVIPLENASDDPSFNIKERVEIGQTLKATVVRRDDGAGRILLSLKEAAALLAWDRLRELLRTQDNVTVRITETTRGGAIAFLEGVRGFIPASRLALTYVEEAELSEWVGKSIEVRVIAADEADKHLVLSAREILRERQAEERSRMVSSVQIGLVTEGTVQTIKPYGAFVDLGNGLSGLLHVSQISQKRVKNPAAVLKEGQKVKVKIIDQKDGKISLSMKALEDVMAEEIQEEKVEIPESEAIGTSLGSLLKNIKLD